MIFPSVAWWWSLQISLLAHRYRGAKCLTLDDWIYTFKVWHKKCEKINFYSDRRFKKKPTWTSCFPAVADRLTGFWSGTCPLVGRIRICAAPRSRVIAIATVGLSAALPAAACPAGAWAVTAPSVRHIQNYPTTLLLHTRHAIYVNGRQKWLPRLLICHIRRCNVTFTYIQYIIFKDFPSMLFIQHGQDCQEI